MLEDIICQMKLKIKFQKIEKENIKGKNITILVKFLLLKKKNII